MIFTTISEVLANKPCSLDKVEKLKAFIGFDANGFTQTTPISLSAVLKSNGLNDTYWVLNLSEKGRYLLKTYAIWNAENVLPIWEKQYPNDNRPRLAIEAAKKALENPSDENRKRAAYAAFNADDAACAAAASAAGACDAAARANAARAARAAVFADFASAAIAASYAAAARAEAAFEKEQKAELLRLMEEVN